jgi:hypothetical protein
LAKLLGECEDGTVTLLRVKAVPVKNEIGSHVGCRFFRGDRAGVVAAGPLGQQPGRADAENALEDCRGDVGDLADGVQTVTTEGGRGRRADPGQRGHRSGPQPGVRGSLVTGDLSGVSRRGRCGCHGRQHAVARETCAAVDAVQGHKPQLRQLDQAIGVEVEVSERRGQVELDGVGGESLDVRGDAGQQVQHVRVLPFVQYGVQVQVSDVPWAGGHPALPGLV